MSNSHNWNKEMQKQVLRCKPSRFENIYIFEPDLLALGTFLGLIVLKLSVLFPLVSFYQMYMSLCPCAPVLILVTFLA